MTVIVETKGSRANSASKEFQSRVINTLTLRGFIHSDSVNADKVILTNQTYFGIYGTTARHDLVIATRSGYRLAIELSWQSVSGSVDQKFPYKYLNASWCSPEQNILFVFDGGAQNQAAVEWIKEKAKQRWSMKEGKVIEVFDNSTDLFNLLRTL